MKFKRIGNLYMAFLGLMTVSGLTAQTIEPQDGTITHNDKLRPCIAVSLDPKPDELKEAWRDYLDDNYDFKLKGIGFLQNKDLLSAEEVTINKISPDKMEFYTHIVANELGSEMKVFAVLGEENYIGRENMRKQYKALNGIVQNFLKEYLPVYYREMLEDTTKNFEDLTKDIEDLNEEIVDDTERIEKLKKEIEDLNDDIESNKETLEKTKETLTVTEKRLARIKAQSLIYNK
ncbi:coiled-coil domain-containing protein [Sediminicola sp. 1XM1-17]|uniref:coiled-coil domain-containing protein n=1 Tax=Sediminicola sp. 1XM1-17 TaxID=3127702 RepID=UPI00307792DA